MTKLSLNLLNEHGALYCLLHKFWCIPFKSGKKLKIVHKEKNIAQSVHKTVARGCKVSKCQNVKMSNVCL